MSFVEFLLICGTIALHSLQISASIPAPKPGQASLVIIFDTTGSMHDDLEELRKGAAFIVRKMMTEEKNPIYNYIFVPFNDPHFGPIFVTRNPQELLRKLDGVTVDGGGDCPEMSISGIKMALTECLPDSFVYVFTDADEKDSHLVPDVLTLIQKKRISITFIAAEGCDSTFKTYYSIAKKSNGQVYKIKSRDTNTILEHIGDTLDEGLQTLKVAYFEGAGAHEFGVDVDKSVKDFSVSVSGSDPNITVRNPEDEISEKAKTVIDLPRVKTVKVKDPEPGRWVVDASSTSGHSVKIAGVSDLKFDFGFSLHTPANIDEASPRPFRGYTNKFCVAPSDPAAIEKFTVVRFFKDDPKNEFELILNMELIDKSKMISCVAFSPPPGAFKIEIKGVDSSGYAFSRFLPTALETSDVTKPQYLGESLEQSIEMAPNTSVELNCKMAGKPEPSIEWMQEDKVIPGVSGDVHRIKHDKEKPLRKYSCVGTNTEGSAKVTFHVTSAQPPQLMQELLKHKNDSAIKLLAGETLEINCPVKGVPDPTIKWIKNGIFISDREENINSLTIPSVKEFDEGEYECIAENDYGNVSLRFALNLEEAPSFTVGTDDINFDSKRNRYVERIKTLSKNIINLECPVTGKPKPDITWFYEDPSDIVSRKFKVRFANGERLTILAANGPTMYTCVANNTRGVLEKVFMIDTLQVPKLINPNSVKIRVKSKQDFSLDCSVKSPDSDNIITWFRSGEILKPDESKFVASEDGYKLTILNTDTKDDIGVYSCLLENDAGSTEKTFMVMKAVFVKWSAWSRWTRCNCHLSLQYRSRYCQYNDGSFADRKDRILCVGEPIESRNCSC